MGCGSDIPKAVMGEGSSNYLDSINILYSRESIDNFLGFDPTEENIKYVSYAMVKGALIHAGVSYNEEAREDDLRVIVVTASTFVTNQRKGRLNRYVIGYIDLTKDYDPVKVNIDTDELTYTSRALDESLIADHVAKLLKK